MMLWIFFYRWKSLCHNTSGSFVPYLTIPHQIFSKGMNLSSSVWHLASLADALLARYCMASQKSGHMALVSEGHFPFGASDW